MLVKIILNFMLIFTAKILSGSAINRVFFTKLCPALQSPAPGKKGKGSPAVKGKGSPGKPGKGGAPPTEAPPTETSAKSHVETPEQLAQRQRMGQLFKEHKAAIEKEGSYT
jgi:hypothetical protein